MKVCEQCRARFRGEQWTCPLDGAPLRELPDPLIGRMVAGRYQITSKIGAGGMGTVYRARHEAADRDVAVKFLATELAADPTNRARFLREAKAAGRVNHEHIIDLTDSGETDDGLVFLVMEYLDGLALNAVIAPGPLSPRRAANIALQVARALSRAHDLDVIHRDIKPDNIFLLADRPTDHVKVLDFGLAHMKGELRLTMTGMVFGTPEYMAPEQAQGGPASPSVDLYALGCVLFETLTGRIPFYGNTPDVILQHLRARPPRPSSLVPSIPPALEDLVLKLLEKRPKDRHHDAHHLVEDLKALLDESPGSAASIRAPIESPVVSLEPTQEPSSAASLWRERIAGFRAAVEKHRSVPEAVAAALRKLDELTTALTGHAQSLHEQSRTASTREDDAREARLQIGKALDELGRDESRADRSVQDLDTQIEGMTAQLQALRTQRDARDGERADLSFQIAQLKGRLGSLNAASDVDLTPLRDELSRLDTEVHQLLEALVAGAEPVARFLSEQSLSVEPNSVLDRTVRPAVE